MSDLWFIILWIIGYSLYTLAATYYLFVLLPAYISSRKDYVTNPVPTVAMIKRLLVAKGLEKVPMFKFQITTKGKETKVVRRGIRGIIELSKEPIFEGRLRVDVVTEKGSDRDKILRHFKDPPAPILVHVVPKDYKTPNNTLKKARAHHYMVEERRKDTACERGYIVYMDAESVLKPGDFRRMVYNILKTGKRITEGPIIYPFRWSEAPLICRQMEANRPFHCYHCHKVMTHPPPQHLHGSNLVVEEDLVLEMGWDVGNLDGEPFIAEDIIFGLKAYVKYGKDVFGWHGAQMMEQPPMGVMGSIRQRIRWVMGVWQALEMMKRSKDFKKMKASDRRSIRTSITYRVMLYSLGFLTAQFFFFFVAMWVASIFFGIHVLEHEVFFMRIWGVLLIPGLLLWLGGNQIGLNRILEHTDMTAGQKAAEHLRLLIISPIAAPIETASAMYATLKWSTGNRHVDWIPTPK